MALNLFAANDQWSKRPDDERFWTLREMFDACQGYASQARVAVVDYRQLRADAEGTALALVGPEGVPAQFTHWGFGQLCQRLSAPADYLRRLPAPVAAECVNAGLRRIGEDDSKSNVLFHQNGSLLCRAFLSDDYARIWNWEVLARLLELEPMGWRVPPARPARPDQAGARPATAADVLPNQGDFALRVKEGDMIAPAGLYASDHDMFAFLVNEERRIDDGTAGGLARGVFVSNSEVGAASLKVTRFLYRHVCGNHIVWDAKDVQELRIVHRGRNDRRFAYQLRSELRNYADETATDDQNRIRAAQRFEIAGTKEEVLDRLFGLKILPRKTIEAAYEHAEAESALRPNCGNSPRSAWGMAQGVTSLSQGEAYAEDRVRLDRAAGKILSMAF